VRFFESHNLVSGSVGFVFEAQSVPFLSALLGCEIKRCTDPNTLFRGNTLATKCVDAFMKLAGHSVRLAYFTLLDVAILVLVASMCLMA
jgi:hypothetical protein